MKAIPLFFVAVALCAIGTTGVANGGPVKQWEVVPTSLVSHDEPPLQRIDLTVESTEALNACALKVWSGERLLAEKTIGAIKAGTNTLSVLLREPVQSVDSRWALLNDSQTLAEQRLTWKPPRHWTLYVVKSAHIDIGLHDSQFKQRLMTVGFVDQAGKLADQTTDWPAASRYRYVIEGLWWWLNYPLDRSEAAANEIVGKYVKPGVFGIGASHSGNRTEAYGDEELCRSAYCIQETRDRWHLPMDSMLMVDNNGITWPLVTAYANAGIKYLGFFPNAWNPKTVGNSRVDVGWKSPLPLLFYWQGPDVRSRILVWAAPHYIEAGHAFGIKTCSDRTKQISTPESVAPLMAKQLASLEARYPYDLWLVPNYDDNEPPGLKFAELARAWNVRWRWPELRTVGDLSEPFREVERRFGGQIPTLRGLMTAGWAQHPVSTPTLLAMKREADRLLPVAEKLATLARLNDPDFIYPTVAFRRAWDALICNDEHGYGTSAYKGRPVYDTWMQKQDWIERALVTAGTESGRALKALAAQVSADGPSVIVFNPTLQPRAETVRIELPESCAGLRSVLRPDGHSAPTVVEGRSLSFQTTEIPSLGYALFRLVPGSADAVAKHPSAGPPSMENAFYRVAFGADGTITSLFDKQLGRELVDASAPYRCNQFVYTKDANASFHSPSNARFEVETSPLGRVIVARMDDPISGAAIEQRVTLPAHEKRVDIDNRLDHVSGLAGTNRWYRFGYYAFPFAVPNGEFRVGLNGCDANPYKDRTGHGTDTYHAARDWSYVGNGRFGVALVQFDSQLVECGKIHGKKNTFDGQPSTSHLYSYVFNNWLYGHAWSTGPSHMNLRYRYVIVSHGGGFRDAGVARFAERAVTPMLATVIPMAQKGKLPRTFCSFLSVDAANVGLLALKLSETPGQGIIARFHESDGIAADVANMKTGWGDVSRVTACSVTERDGSVLDHPILQLAPFGYSTLRLEEPGNRPAAPEITVAGLTDKTVALRWSPVGHACQYNIYRSEYAGFAPDAYHLLATTCGTRFKDVGLKAGTAYYYCVAAVDATTRQGEVSKEVQGATHAKGNSSPAKVGSVYTGLIDAPRARFGDTPDILYLQWGQNQEANLSHYELFRGGTPDFVVGEKTRVAIVQPGPYVTVPYEDKGLKPHTVYYYRVLAVGRDGRKGPPSDVCVGITREPFEEK